MAGNQMFWSKSKENYLYTSDRREGNEKEGSQSILNISSLLQRSWGRQGGIVRSKGQDSFFKHGAAPVT